MEARSRGAVLQTPGSRRSPARCAGDISGSGLWWIDNARTPRSGCLRRHPRARWPRCSASTTERTIGGDSSPTATPANGTAVPHSSVTTHLEFLFRIGISIWTDHCRDGTHTPISQFSGENPKIWKTMCDRYFAMHHIHESYFVLMATLHFSGMAAIWLQSVQAKIEHLDWGGFCDLLCTHFGRDRH